MSAVNWSEVGTGVVYVLFLIGVGYVAPWAAWLLGGL